MPVTVQVEPFARCQPELEPLFERAYAEFGQFKDVLPLAPDYARYAALDEAGVIFLVTLRRDGQLVGYMITSVTIGLHHLMNRFAVMDIFYIDKPIRGRGYAFLVMDYVEVQLRNLNVDLWIVHYVRGNSAGLDRVLRKMGFSETEQSAAKYLGA